MLSQKISKILNACYNENDAPALPRPESDKIKSEIHVILDHLRSPSKQDIDNLWLILAYTDIKDAEMEKKLIALSAPFRLQKDDVITQSLSSMSFWVAQNRMEITDAQAINTMKVIKKIAGIEQNVAPESLSKMSLWIEKNCLSGAEEAKKEGHISPANTNVSKK
jgi:hypothetical protein